METVRKTNISDANMQKATLCYFKELWNQLESKDRFQQRPHYDQLKKCFQDKSDSTDSIKEMKT